MAAQGVDFIIQVNTGTDVAPVWTKVAGQRGATLNRSVDTIDATTKDSDGWMEQDYGMRSWSIDADGLLVESDAGYAALEDAYTNLTKVKVQLQTAAGNKYTGTALLTDFPIEAPYDDDATYSCTLDGDGPLTITAV